MRICESRNLNKLIIDFFNFKQKYKIVFDLLLSSIKFIMFLEIVITIIICFE